MGVSSKLATNWVVEWLDKGLMVNFTGDKAASDSGRLSGVKPDFKVDTVLGLKDQFDEINGVSLRMWASLSPPPERLPGM
eukprot:1176893-Prorocentrum_minimum.AAC.6